MRNEREPLPIAHVCGVEYDAPIFKIKPFQHFWVCDFKTFENGFFRDS